MVRYKSFLYQAASSTKARRVVAKAEFHFGGLFQLNRLTNRIPEALKGRQTPNRPVLAQLWAP
jgi:hypothetical protein